MKMITAGMVIMSGYMRSCLATNYGDINNCPLELSNVNKYSYQLIITVIYYPWG